MHAAPRILESVGEGIFSEGIRVILAALGHSFWRMIEDGPEMVERTETARPGRVGPKVPAGMVHVPNGFFGGSLRVGDATPSSRLWVTNAAGAPRCSTKLAPRCVACLAVLGNI